MLDNKEFVISGPYCQVPISNKSVGKIVLESLLLNTQSHDAMVDAFSDRRITYQTILHESCNLAQALRIFGCTNSTVIAIYSENNLNWYIPAIASLLVGSITAPINHYYMEFELKHILNILEPKLIFVSINMVSKIIALKKDFLCLEKIIIFNSNESVLGSQNLKNFINEQLKGQEISPYDFQPWSGDINEQVACIMSSSGTTGLSKGVMLTHKNLNTVFAQRWDLRYSESEEVKQVVTAIVPFYHMYGFMSGLESILKENLIVVFDHFDEEVLLKAIQNYKVTFLNIVPSIAGVFTKTNKLKEYDMSSVIRIACGGSSLSVPLECSLKKRLGVKSIMQAFGQTEVTFACTLVDKGDHKVGTCGKVLPFVSLKVCDLKTERALGPNQVGEIRLKGPTVMKGYYKNKKATEEVITADGWLKTGDLGYFDDNNYIYIVDRLKELIKYKAFQIPPNELECLIIAHPKVLEVAVVGRPDEEVGELPTAFVVKLSESLTEKELQDYIAERVSPQKKLRGGVIFLPSLPKNSTGKILRRVLRERLQNAAKQKSKL